MANNTRCDTLVAVCLSLQKTSPQRAEPNRHPVVWARVALSPSWVSSSQRLLRHVVRSLVVVTGNPKLLTVLSGRLCRCLRRGLPRGSSLGQRQGSALPLLGLCIVRSRPLLRASRPAAQVTPADFSATLAEHGKANVGSCSIEDLPDGSECTVTISLSLSPRPPPPQASHSRNFVIMAGGKQVVFKQPDGKHPGKEIPA